MNEDSVIKRIDELEKKIDRRFEEVLAAFRQWAQPMETRQHVFDLEIKAIRARLVAIEENPKLAA